MRKTSFFYFLVFISFAFISCATTIDFDVTRPAELDTNGAKTISILPIKSYDAYQVWFDTTDLNSFFHSFFGVTTDGTGEENRMINYLYSNLEKRFVDSPYFDVVSASAVEDSISRGYLNPADLYITGEVAYFYVNDYKDQERILVEREKDDKKAQYKIVDFYYRDVRLDFKYQIIDSSSNKIIYSDIHSISRTSNKGDSVRELPDPYYLVEDDLSYIVFAIIRKVQPYSVRREVTLLKDKTKNPNMKTAMKLVKDENITEAYKIFEKVYDETNMFEAGYNIALIQEAWGNFSKAEKMMSDLYEETLDTRALRALEDIQYEIEQAKRLSSQTEEKSMYLD